MESNSTPVSQLTFAQYLVARTVDQYNETMKYLEDEADVKGATFDYEEAEYISDQLDDDLRFIDTDWSR